MVAGELKTNLIIAGDTSKEVLISFLIPTYNRLETLATTINSIKTNNKFDYEIIITDNSEINNTENTKKHLTKLNDKHISYYVNDKNYGMVDNWNVGLTKARGKYVAYIHDDDVIDKNYFDVIYELLFNKIQNRKMGFIKSNFDYFSKDSEIKDSDKLTFRYKRILKIDSILDGIGPTYAPTCGLLFSREALLKVRGFNPLYHPCADHIVGFKILNEGYEGFNTEDVIGHYRWGINESLKKDTLINTVEKNYIIREHFYSNNFFYQIFGFIFRKYYYTRDVKTYLSHAKRFKQNIELNEMVLRDNMYIKNSIWYKNIDTINKIFVKIMKFILKVVR